AVQKTLELKPKAYWRLDEFAGPRAVDSSPNGIDAIYEPRVLFYLPGPNDAAFAKGGINRSAFFAGDRLSARIPGLTGRDYTVSLWFWSGTANGVMDGTEWIFSRGTNHGSRNLGDHVGIREEHPGVRSLVFETSGKLNPIPPESAKIERWKWHHLAIARDGNSGHVFLDGIHLVSLQEGSIPESNPDTFFFGGSCT
ncbi:MAG TPA: hypothetical protein PLA50_04635, partial [Bacteroidia bacterium]|nr:hypothetical protein [Bacteroidia bacterium]